MKTFFKILAFIIYMIGAMFKTIKLKLLKKYSSKEKYTKYLNTSVYKWANAIVKIVGINLEVVGKENIPNEACLFVSNHQSNLDVPCLIAGLNKPFGFIAKKELVKAPIIKTWMQEIKCVFIDRKNVRESLKAILKGAENLNNGHNMVIFPEGTRSKSSKLGEFKKGSMKLATKAKVKVVPITIDGTYKGFEGNEGFQFKSANVKIIVHQPIEVKGLDREEKNELAEKVKEIIASGLHQ
ncbi:lysophospholipid acyltransferase family protein [Haloimpatiens sp. FM7330]|uniref:lysophospholipid acyltransferase family protein n=1 Tax=Haloimpatiens sp. FM7330 TaxID=3298610 RepID=UPI00363FDF47